MNIKKFIIQLLESISFDHRYRKKVKAYKKIKDQYLSMDDEEFTTNYVEIKAKYEYKIINILLTAIFLSMVTFAIIKAFPYLYDRLKHLILISKKYGENFNSITYLLIIIFSIIILCGIWIICNKSRYIYNLNKKRLYLEEIKKMRREK